MTKEFKYVIARPWVEWDKSNLCIYTYFSEIHKGTMKDAQNMLKYVKGKIGPEYKEYSIYKVKFKKVD